MRAPLSGCCAAYSARIAISAGISDSAILISLRPQSPSDRSATRKSVNLESATAALMIDGLHKGKAPAPFPMRAPLTHVASLLSLTPLIRPRGSRGRNAPQRTGLYLGRVASPRSARPDKGGQAQQTRNM